MDVDKLPENQPVGQVTAEVILQLGRMPENQLDREFLQGMVNRLAVGFHRYGPWNPDRADWVATAEDRLREYKETGNIDWLIDVSNFIMFEYMSGHHPDAHSDPNAKSPGYISMEGQRRHFSEAKPVTDYKHEGD